MLRRRNERGNEGISALLALPIVIALLFGTVEVAWNFRTRGLALGVVSDITRGGAADGGTNNFRTRTLAWSWEQEGRRQLTVTQFCQCTSEAALMVGCASGPPQGGKGVPTGSPAVVANSGDDLVCSIDYPYRPLTVMFRGSVLQTLGFKSVLGPFRVTHKARAETGANTVEDPLIDLP